MPVNLRRYLLLFLLLATSWCSLAQRKSDQTLLWRITGKGLTKPSYLYGTLHLKQKKIFVFDDSLYAAIEHTDGLAIEVNLNEILGYYINKLLEEQDDDKKITDVLSEKELNKLKEPLSRKFNKNIKDITTKDIVKEKNKWMSDYLDKGEMPTFIDAYLYDIARRQGKWMGGIEDVADQISLIDRNDVNQVMEGDSSFSTENIVNLYINQDLDGINKLYNNYDSFSKSTVLTLRNIKMARRMDSLSAFRSMFFAVGAAHLPGDSGVIHLLRARGFTVEPVFSEKRIQAKNYHFTEVPVAWSEVHDHDSLYQVSMPGIPSTITMYGLIEMKFMLEFSNLSGFCTMAFVSPGDASQIDSVFARIAGNIFKNKKLKRPDRFEKDGVAGVEYTDRIDQYVVRLQLFQKENTACMLWVYGKKEAYLKTPDVEKFFSSFKFTPRKIDMRDEYTFTDSLSGITFTSPVNVTPNTAMVKQNNNVKGWDLGFFTGQDKKTGAYILVATKQTHPGNYIVNDSSVLEDIAAYFTEKYHVTKTWTTLDGYRTLKMEGSAKNIYMKAVTFVRGNKNVSVMLITESKTESPALAQVFSTLHTIPFKQPQWQTISDPARTYTTEAPGQLRPDEPEDSTQPTNNYFCFDTLSAMSYFVTTDTLNRYTYTSDDATFLKSKLLLFIGKQDTLINSRITTNGKDPAIDAIVQKGKSNVYRRIRIVSHGNVIYNLVAGGEKDVLGDKNSDLFFNKFATHWQSDFKLHENKLRLLLNDLKSKDSVTLYTAYEALKELEFTEADLPLLQEAALTTYPAMFIWKDKTAVNDRLSEAIQPIANAATVSYIRKNYSKLTAEKEELKYTALNILAAIGTKDSYDAIAALLTTAPPRSGYQFAFSNRVGSNLPLLKTIYPTLSVLAADTSVGVMIAGFSAALLDSGLSDLATIKKSEDDLIKLSSGKIPSLLASDEFEYGYIKLLSLLDTINTSNTNAALAQYLNAKNIYLRRTAALMLAKKDLPVPPAIWDSIAALSEMRNYLYKDLQKIHKEKLFPASYCTRELFAESALYNAALENEDLTFVSLDLLEERIMAFDADKKYQFYIYRVTYTNGDDTSRYLGVAGAYEADTKSLFPENDKTGIYYKEGLTEENLNTLFNDYLNQDEEAPPVMDLK